MSAITLYSRTPCGYCSLAKRMLKERGLAFHEVDLTTQSNIERELVTRTGQRTVPQIFIGDRFIGGYTELAALIRDGRLSSMLAACST